MRLIEIVSVDKEAKCSGFFHTDWVVSFGAFHVSQRDVKDRRRRNGIIWWSGNFKKLHVAVGMLSVVYVPLDSIIIDVLVFQVDMGGE